MQGFTLNRRALVAAGMTVALAASAYAGYAYARQTHMHNAIGYLESAKSELKQAKHNKGGHRGNAIDLINSAIKEVKRGIKHARD